MVVFRLNNASNILWLGNVYVPCNVSDMPMPLTTPFEL